MNYQKLKNSPKIVMAAFGGVERSLETLPPAVYKVTVAGMQNTPVFEELNLQERLVDFTTGEMADFMNESEHFFNEKTIQVYKDMGVTHKIGFIIYGKHGTGKTCLALNLMRQMVHKYDALCLDCTEEDISIAAMVCREIRKYQNNPIVIFMDECDSDIKSNENRYLPFLDGTSSLSGTMFLGCTNYIDKIPERIRDRKSRIKKCYEIKGLPVEIYKEFLLAKIPEFDKKLCAQICYQASEKELTLDQFKDALLNYQLGNGSVEEVLNNSLTTYK